MEASTRQKEKKTGHMSVRDMALVPVFSVLIAVCAWVSIPAPVPFTMQTFGVFFTLVLLGGKRGVWAVAVYLLLGAIGVPVFAGFAGGPGVLLGMTGGYLMGFLLVALTYWLMTALLGERLWVAVAALSVGLLLCYVFGTAWFLMASGKTGNPMGLTAALGYCVLPFLLPDGVKLALALALGRKLKPRLKLD